MTENDYESMIFYFVKHHSDSRVNKHRNRFWDIARFARREPFRLRLELGHDGAVVYFLILFRLDNTPLNNYFSTMYYRNITSKIEASLKDIPVIFLNGTRQPDTETEILKTTTNSIQNLFDSLSKSFQNLKRKQLITKQG
jgi:hypothetical protein